MRVIRRITLATVVLAATVMLPHASVAQSPSPSSPAAPSVAAAGAFRGYVNYHFDGPSKKFSGEVGDCKYVGGDWNDKIRSARTNTRDLVELWEHHDCTGYSITIDRTGYGRIGPWVSAYRVTRT
ncbi:peptidase inhibitor family I36 protein [Streptomyces boncukensis]|uniref:Uncharacterized protein n=1 Tax=Streptomyces boncukensis TaxID=2711219 RepID=A0A6G4X0I4_9ACTN|nr:peptidase inhibitor family I36 protein [Streptomyces boncukensis]NGO70898.1 hypothetical protein [Streptomyces boncukensis]